MKNTIQKSALSTNLVAFIFVLCGAQLHAQDDDATLINVTNLEQLNAIRHDVDGDGSPTAVGTAEYTSAFGTVTCVGGCKGYELMVNLDFNAASSYASNTISTTWTTGSGWTPIGYFNGFSDKSLFNAIFEGNGHTISNLLIDRSSNNVGLFGYVNGNSAALRNIGLLEVEVTGSSYVGGLVGWNEEGTVSNSYATGSVEGSNEVGGLVGQNSSGTVSNSYATSAVTSTGGSVGGLVGYSFESTVSGSYATGSVTGGRLVGGLVGRSKGGISNSYATGTVVGGSDVGGLVGSNSSGTITTSYYNRQNTEQSDTGKGDPKTTAELLVPTGYMGIYETWDDGPDNTAGNDDDTDYWDFGTNEEYPVLKIDVDGNGTVGDADDLRAQRPLRLDADGDGLIEVRTLEQLNAIRYDLDGNGEGVTNEVAYSAAFGTRVLAGIITGYELMANLDFELASSYASGTINTDWTTGSGWEPIGVEDNAFTTTFEGNGHTISNLFINNSSTSYAGLFGYISGGSAELHNLGMVDVEVTGGFAIGGLVGVNEEGTVSGSYVTGSVTGDEDVGGLVGGNYTGGTVSNSYATGSVTGTGTGSSVGGLVGFNNKGTISSSYATGAVTGTGDNVGGLVGDNRADIVSSYATGAVTGNEDVGGLVGSNWDSISNSYATGAVMGSSHVGGLVGDNFQGTVSGSYATGAVTGSSHVGGLVGRNFRSTVTASYYNRQTTGQNDTGKGEPKTTADLLTPTGYMGIYGSWDDGTDTASTSDNTDYWDFGTNGQYPVLKLDVDGSGTVGEVADLRAQRPLRFRQTSYAFTILNTAGINDVVGIVRAVPEDANNELTYSMDTSVEFSISSEDETDNPFKVGQISVKAGLSPNTYILNLEVTEAGRTATVEVRIRVGASLDADEDGLIEVSTFEQLNAIRYDLDGDGTPTEAGMTEYTTAFGADRVPEKAITGYELMNNLDFATSRWGEGASGGDKVTKGWEPIGDNSTRDNNSRFTAIFEGNGHTISNLFIDRSSTDYVGLFGYVNESSAALRNIGLLEVNVTGDDYVGGLVGTNFESTVSNSYATGSVTGGDEDIGGLVGSSFGDIVSSYATGSVTGSLSNVGGLVGRHDSGMVSNSYATGAVRGVGNVGGLVGRNDGTVSGSYATGSVSGTNRVGGLVGESTRGISGSYATGAVTGSRDVGGLVGDFSGTITASYYNSETTGQSDMGKGEGKTTAELLAPTGYTGIYATWGGGGTDDWDFGTNGQYPVLKIDVDGNGIAGEPADLALQRPASLNVDPTSLHFTAMGGDMEFTIIHNAVWTAEVSTGDSWLTLDMTSGGSGTTTLRATAVGNVASVTRMGTLTITAGTLTQTVNVTQEAVGTTPTPTLTVSETTLTFVATGEGKDFTITTTEDWTAKVSVGDSWLTLSSGSGSGDMTITATVQKNLGAERMATVTITSGTLTQTVNVTQVAVGTTPTPTLTVSETTLIFVATGEGKDFTITTTEDWTAEVSAGDSWLTLSSGSGSGDMTITATVQENLGAERMATITITSGTLTQTINVTQVAVGTTPTPTLTVSETTLTFVATGEGKDFTITTTEDWTAEVSAGDIWLTLNMTSGGSGTTTLRATAVENVASVTRMGTLTITAGTLTQTVNVTQEAVGTTPTPTLTVSETTLTFVATGEGKDFTITTTEDWTAEVSAGDIWLTLSSGSGSGDMTITATVQENLGAERMATITITSGTLTQTINVTQGAGTQTVLLAVPVIPASMRVYPNPTSGQLRFTELSSNQRYTYGLYSLVAQKIRSGQINGGEHIDLGGDFPEGQYILVLQTEEGRELLRSRVQVVK